MYEGQTIAVVVPAHNEESHVAGVINSLPDFVDRIYAIDDASTDQTWMELQQVADRLNRHLNSQERFNQRVVPIRHDQNRGAGGAVITGYRQAREDGIDVTAVMDGDGQMDPADLDRIVAPVARGEADYAKGTRLLHPENRCNMSRWRLFGNAVLTMLTRIASGYWEMSDPQNGYTAISRDALLSLPLAELYPKYGFLNDVLVHLHRDRWQIADVSHRGLYGDERSGIRYRTFVPGLSRLLLGRFLARIKRDYLVRRFHPLVVCYSLGAFLTSMASVAMVRILSRGDSRLTDSLLTVLLGGIGVLSMAFGAVCDVQENRGRVVHYDHPLRAEQASSEHVEVSETSEHD